MKQPFVMGTSAGTHRQIALVRSRAEFVRLLGPGASDHYVKNYASETGNDEELFIANAFPGVLLRKPNDYRDGSWWRRGDTGEYVRAVRTFSIETKP